MPGSNLKFGERLHLFPLIAKAMKAKAVSVRSSMNGSGLSVVCWKNGPPANNTANDSGDAVGVVCYDAANKAVYAQTAWSSNSSHTWTKISA